MNKKAFIKLLYVELSLNRNGWINILYYQKAQDIVIQTEVQTMTFTKKNSK